MTILNNCGRTSQTYRIKYAVKNLCLKEYPINSYEIVGIHRNIARNTITSNIYIRISKPS